MYLTKMELELSNPGIRAALRDCQKMHKLVTGLFGTQRKDTDVLYRSRIKGTSVELYLYSRQPILPDRLLPSMRMTAQRDISSLLDKMETGQTYRFQLVTMPFKKVAEKGSRNSRRRILHTPDERLAWLERKALQGGFVILSVSETPGEKLYAKHPAEAGGNLTMDAWCYTGLLQIQDVDSFRKSYAEGIGPGKAYGLGMLILSGG